MMMTITGNDEPVVYWLHTPREKCKCNSTLSIQAP